MTDLFENPMGTDGFEFVEYAAPEPELLRALFEQLGFVEVAHHRSKDVTLHRQGDINFIINAEADSFAQKFAKIHGPCVCAMAFRVKDACKAYENAVLKGAKVVEQAVGPMELNIPAVEGIGGSRLYLVDRYGESSIYDVDFIFTEGFSASNCSPKTYDVDYMFCDVGESQGASGTTVIDHLTHNVFRGNMDKWASFYEDLFNFREVRYFDIEGKLTGLKSRAMTSPCGKIRIPINESSDEKSQIEEYLKDYNGEGIQHIALSTDDIYRTVDYLKRRSVDFQETPATYYDAIDERVEEHNENIAHMKSRGILIDGAPTEGQGVLLQIFTKTVIGPIFFEIIQRKGNEGFGEGNFQALFESIERDQIERGVIQE
jgi:4-hydroxyphenylpyruvate dioxygenase